MSYSVFAQIGELQKWVGFREGGNGGNVQPFTAWQFHGGLSNLAWCDSFAQWAAVKYGGFVWPNYCQNRENGDAYVPFNVTHAKDMGIWKPANSLARSGWQAIYDWSGSGGDHIETVIQDLGSNTLNIGGNTGDMVAYRNRPKNYGLLGFAALDEAGQNSSVHTPIPPIFGPSTGGSDMKETDKVDAASLGSGDWVLQADGGIFSYRLPFYGSVPSGTIKLIMGVNHAISILVTSKGKGYWILGFDGGVFSYGDASYHGNFTKAAKLSKPIKLVAAANGSYKAILSNGTIATPN